MYCDSSVSIPFNLVNLTSTRVKAEFDLSKFQDFKLQFLEEDVDGLYISYLFCLGGSMVYEWDIDCRDYIFFSGVAGPDENGTENTFTVDLAGKRKLPCQLSFMPTAVSIY